jgi:hypothetical protein
LIFATPVGAATAPADDDAATAVPHVDAMVARASTPTRCRRRFRFLKIVVMGNV